MADLHTPVASTCCASVAAAAEKERAELIAALQGMVIEWDRLTRYGSSIAKAGNERVNAARAALAKAGASV